MVKLFKFLSALRGEINYYLTAGDGEGAELRRGFHLIQRKI